MRARPHGKPWAPGLVTHSAPPIFMEDNMDIKNLVKFIKAGYKASEIIAIPVESRQQYIDLLDAGVDKSSIADYADLLREQDDNSAGGDDGGESGGNGGKPEDNDESNKPDYEKLYNDLLIQQQHRETHENMGDMDKPETAYDILKAIIE